MHYINIANDNQLTVTHLIGQVKTSLGSIWSNYEKIYLLFSWGSFFVCVT